MGSLAYCPAVMTGNNTVWYLPRDHYAYKLHFDFSAGYDEKHARFQWQKVKIGEHRTFEVFESPRGFYTLNSVGEIHHHDIMSHTVRLIRDLRQEVDTYGKVTKIVPLGNDIYVSFANAGVMRLDGNNAELGRKILSDANHPLVQRVDTMDGAADKAAELAAAK